MPRPRDYATQKRILAAIRKHPGISYREICAVANISSISLVYYYVNLLKRDGTISSGRYRSHRTIHVSDHRSNNSQETREKKAAAGRKAKKILEKGAAGLDVETLRRIELIGQREDERKREHSTDVIGNYPRGVRIHNSGLRCSKLG